MITACDEGAEILADYTKTLADFEFVTPVESYDHMGATITDAVLQAGINYETVVEPRVNNLLKNYPEAATLDGFSRLLDEKGIDSFFEWKKGDRKLKTIEAIIDLFQSEGIQDEKQLKEWLAKDQNISQLLDVYGIGNKTVDYLKILVGYENSVAVDVHLKNFIKRSGIQINGNDYKSASDIISKAAELLGVTQNIFDHSIWRYMRSIEK